MVNADRAFALLQKIGFTRIAGTEEEMRAAGILKAECESFGLDASIEEFDIDFSDICEASFKITEPYEKEYNVRGFLCAASTAEGGLEAPFCYVENGLPANLVGVKGAIVLVNPHFLRLPLYRELMKAGAAAVLVTDGELRDKTEETDLHQKKLRALLRNAGVIPAASVRTTDAMEMVAKNASKAKLTMKVRDTVLKSHNVLAEIKGTEYPEEIICFGAHYDSVEFSKGVYDNGAGSVAIMEAARYFAEHPPKRTLRFCWFGSEEIGLEGSKAFVRDHKDIVENCRLMINADVGGPILGINRVAVTGSEDLLHYTQYKFDIEGIAAETRQGIYSSDSIPFADNGVPAVNFSRDGAPGAAYIHNRFDTMDFLSAPALAQSAEMVMQFAEPLVNSQVFPVKREIPDNIREEVDGYLYKKETEELLKAKG